MKTIQLSKFDIGRITAGNTICVIGGRATGKTHLIRHILSELDMTKGLVISPKLHYEKPYHPKCLEGADEYDEKSVEYFEALPDATFVVFDECLYKQELQTDSNLIKKLMMAPHKQTLYIIGHQTTCLPQALTDNIDYIFIFRQDNTSTQQSLYGRYGALFDTFEDFRNTLKNMREYECLVIRHTGPVKPFKESCFWFKAPE